MESPKKEALVGFCGSGKLTSSSDILVPLKGPMQNYKGLGCTRILYDSTLETRLLMRWPGIEKSPPPPR